MDTSDPRRWRALAVLGIAYLMVVLDVAIVNVALPSIQKSLHFSTSSLEWVVSGYSLTFGGFLLLGGRAGDLLGRRRVFMAGLLLFSVVSLLPIRRAEVDVGKLLEGVATRFARRAQDESRSIEVAGDGSANIDRLRVEQALGNLVENALRRGAGTIRVSARHDDGPLLLVVSDEGKGSQTRSSSMRSSASVGLRRAGRPQARGWA